MRVFIALETPVVVARQQCRLRFDSFAHFAPSDGTTVPPLYSGRGYGPVQKRLQRFCGGTAKGKGDRPLLPERPAGCCAQKGSVPILFGPALALGVAAGWARGKARVKATRGTAELADMAGETRRTAMCMRRQMGSPTAGTNRTSFPCAGGGDARSVKRHASHVAADVVVRWTAGLGCVRRIARVVMRAVDGPSPRSGNRPGVYAG